MNTLIGRTFSYRYHGKELIRKVVDIIRGKEPMYKLLDPVNHTWHEARVKDFNHTFKHHSPDPIIRDRKKQKGKTIRSKQLQNIFE
jgi:hypothetical protein